jgi:hypothetical protein
VRKAGNKGTARRDEGSANTNERAR